MHIYLSTLQAALCLLLLILLTLPSAAASAQQSPLPSPRQPFIISTTLPNGRHITPQGAWIKLAPYPFALAIRPDGQQAVLPSIGWPFSLNIVDNLEIQPRLRRRRLTPAGSKPASVHRLPQGSKNDPDVQVLNGVVFAADGALLYDATGDTGAIDLYNTHNWQRTGRISLDGDSGGHTYAHSFAACLALSPDGRTLYALDQGSWRVVAIDLLTRKRLWSVPTGANPSALALSPDGKHLYITNSGLFEYQPIPGETPGVATHARLKFPPFGYPSAAAREGATVEGHTVPGLGPENSPRGSSLWTYQLDASSSVPAEPAKLRLGAPIEENALNGVLGGASPSAVIAGATSVFVALAHQDSVAVLSADGREQLSEIPLTPFHGPAFEDAEGRPLRGIMPSGLALHGQRLYVTEAGINAVGVINTETGRVLGHRPVGWYPSAATISPDGRLLYVVNTKGQGSGPNSSGNNGKGTYIGELEFGSLSTLDLTAARESTLPQSTAVVVRNNLAALTAQRSLPRLQHVFLVIRENRTFDEILGDLSGVDGEPALARWGMHGWFASSPSDKTRAVTPNAHALATRFGTSDRFFVDSDVSADGHRWIVGAEETPWFHLAWTSNYGGRRTSDPKSDSPGRRAMTGGSDGPMPEDEPEFGTLWEHVQRAGLTIRNYGEGLELEGSDEGEGMEPEGQRMDLNSPVPLPVFTSTDRTYPTFNLGIPDQFRYTEFARDFEDILASGHVPSLIVIRLPNDHTARPRPQDGYPDAASYVADNDLALGRIVDLVSHSSIWSQSAILVTEDDAQGGVDHVDAHRSVMLAISPYVHPGAISHTHSSMGSLQKTAYQLLGIGPLNLEDALAGNLSDLFETTPDLRPYVAVDADPRVFLPSKAKFAHPRTAAEAKALLDFDDPDEIRKSFRRSVTSHTLHHDGDN